MNMNSFEGKRILALIREGDQAHAGQEEAPARSFRSIPKNADSRLLDVGPASQPDNIVEHMVNRANLSPLKTW